MEYRRMVSSIRLDMLALLGDSYISQHCYNVMKTEALQRIYNQYVTDALFAIATRHELKQRYADIVREIELQGKPVSKPKETEEEVLARFRKSFGKRTRGD